MVDKNHFSEQYRSMIYFVVATLYMYQGDMEWSAEISVSPEDFVRSNPLHKERVIEECRTCFNYELSYHQVMTGVSAYIKSRMRPQKVSEQPVFNPEIY